MTYIIRLGQIQKQIEQIIDTGGGGSGTGVNAEVQAELDDLQSQINTLNTNVNSFDSNIANLQSQINNLDLGSTNYQTLIDDLQSQINNLTTTVNNEFDSIETQLSTINTNINNANIDIDDLETQFTTLNTTVSNLNTTISNIQTELTSYITEAEVQTKIDNLQTQINNLGSSESITNLQTEVDTIQSDITALQTEVDGLFTNTEVQDKVDNLQSQLNTVTSNITSLNTTDTNLQTQITNLVTSTNSAGINWSDITANTIPSTFNPVTHASRHIPGGTDIIPNATTSVSGLMANTDKTKLDGIATGATLNSTDAFLLNRANHTGTATTINTNAVERSTSGTLSLGATANNTTLEIGSLATVINVGTGAVAKTINIGGHASDVLNIIGSVVSQNVTNTNILDKLITINKGGAAASADGSGFEIEEAASITSYFKIGNTRNSFDIKSPARSGILRFTPSNSAFTHEIITANSANRTLTLPNADLNLSSQNANLIYASPNGSIGTPSFRSLVDVDYPLATNTTRGAISKETSGTFTPILQGSTTAGVNTYTNQIGNYYLVGKICCTTIYIILSTKDAAMAGNLIISGLPINSAAFLQAATITQFSNITFSTNNTQLTARIESSNDRILLFQGGSGLASTVIQASQITSSFLIILTANYITV